MRTLLSKKGFTLVEMIVALGIFTVVAVVAVGSLVRITDANKKSISLKTTINNLNFALESLSREMRVGAVYNCSNNVNRAFTTSSFTESNCSTISSGDWTIAFKSSHKGTSCNLIYAYSYNAVDGTIRKAEQSDCNNPINSGDYRDLISRDIKITNTIVSVDTTNQPRAFFWFKGYNGAREKEKTEFEVQTSVSQRIGN